MDEHLSDLAALEWSRFSDIRLSGVEPEAVRAHLRTCAACRRKVEAFGRLDRLVHPYGSPPPEDRRPIHARRLALVLGLAVLLSALGWLLGLL